MLDKTLQEIEGVTTKGTVSKIQKQKYKNKNNIM